MNNNPITFTTGRLLLRGLSSDDIRYVYEGLSHPEVIRHYGVSFNSLEATKEQMDWFATLEQTGQGKWWAICSPDNSVFYGAGGLNNVNKQHKKAEIGFWLLPQYWGMGILQEVFPFICRFGFEQLGLHRIEGFVESDNLKCKKAMAKLAFRHEGTLQDCEIKNGRFISLDVYALLNR